jgi:acyl-CoA synthetase (AMP-forming)/AMP-acid ligase II
MQESKKVTAWGFWHKIAWNSFIYLPLFHIAALAACLNVMHAGGANVILSKSELAEFVASKIDIAAKRRKKHKNKI